MRLDLGIVPRSEAGTARTKWLVGVVLAGVGIALVGAYLSLLQFQRGNPDTTLATVSLGPHDVGGMEREALRDAVRGAAQQLLDQRVTVAAEGVTAGATRRALGLSIDVESTVEAVWSRGRRGLVRAFRDHLAARRGDTIEVRFEREIDQDTFTGWTRRASDQLSREARPANIGLIVAEEPDVVDVHVVEPVAGWAVSSEELAGQVRPALEDTFGPIELDAPGEPVQPEITMEDVERTLPQVNRAVSAPVVLQNPSAGPDLELSPADLALILTVRGDPEAQPGDRLSIAGDSEALREVIGGRLDSLQAPPTEASFEIVGEQVTINGGLPGFELDLETTVQRVVDNAVGEPPRTGELAGRRTPPEFSREEAEALGIRERVSSFTTPFSCCPPRVHNIQLAADILKGTLILPGERLSLNQALGPRTRARGFVSNGYIEDGELRTAVGGGVSQIATTFFNAAWFAGIRIIDFKPHSLYIDRYPMGREATLDWNVIDVVVENDSPHGILINTSHTNTSVTFEFWSTPWASVETETSEPTNRQPGSGRDGFDVTFRRTIQYPDGTSREEEYFHRYQPEN